MCVVTLDLCSRPRCVISAAWNALSRSSAVIAATCAAALRGSTNDSANMEPSGGERGLVVVEYVEMAELLMDSNGLAVARFSCNEKSVCDCLLQSIPNTCRTVNLDPSAAKVRPHRTSRTGTCDPCRARARGLLGGQSGCTCLLAFAPVPLVITHTRERFVVSVQQSVTRRSRKGNRYSECGKYQRA